MATGQDESRLHAVVQTVVDGVILIDAQGHILMFNPACERLFGYRAKEVIGQNVKLLMPTPYRDEHDRYLDNFRRTGEHKIIGIGREVVGQHKNGSTFPVDLSVREAREQGETIFVGIVRDVTERNRAQRDLTESVARLKAVVDTAVDGVILIDAQGHIRMFNPACERLFGYRANEVIGQNVKLLMPAPYRDQHDRYLDNFGRTGERKIIGIGREVVGQRKDGTTFPMDLSVGEAKQAGDSNFVGIIHDLSERKRTSEQLVQAQKMEAVGQLSGGIAHDFNNLLTIIVGNADQLSAQLKAQPDLKRLADDIGRAGDRGSELTQRLLAFSRRQALQPVRIDCNTLVDDMRKLLRRTLREDIEIKTEVEPELWSAFADPVQLESALLNLALNSQDAMPHGGRLTINTANVPLDYRHHHLHPEVPPGQYVMVAVTDNGAGMSSDVLSRAVEPFFTTKEIGKGSGLGLSMVYGFVKQSNGHVAIYSELGLGTTVRIYLPGTTSEVIRPDSVNFVDEIPMSAGKEMVLVAEDDAFVRSYAAVCLESLGYLVVTAADGREALQKLAAGASADILLTDIVMPGGINGWALAERARQIRPSLRVLLTSGYALETLAARGNLPPNVVILHKPYRKGDLARRLREVMSGSPSSAQQVVTASVPWPLC